jgi:thiol-disulfide isomerase/thioredoxin
VWRTFLAFAVPLCLGASVPRLHAQDVGIEVGSVPATATVQDMDGQPVDLAATYAGKKPVLFEFWATWCEICQALLPKMEAAQQRYGAQVDFVVVGVGVNQSINTMRRHIERHPMPFKFYFDNAGAAVRAFQAPSTSFIAVLDARGRVVYTGTGSDQDIEAALARALRPPDTRSR